MYRQYIESLCEKSDEAPLFTQAGMCNGRIDEMTLKVNRFFERDGLAGASLLG